MNFVLFTESEPNKYLRDFFVCCEEFTGDQKGLTGGIGLQMTRRLEKLFTNNILRFKWALHLYSSKGFSKGSLKS